MKVPEGKTEAEVLAAIEKAVGILGPSFVFGFFDVEDVRQQGRLYALEVLERECYDPARPLENFLYSHVRNRLINFRRDKLRRNDPPCRRCHAGDPCGPDGEPCARYAGWAGRNRSKSNLMRPLGLDRVADEGERRTRVGSVAEGEAEVAELLKRIDEGLPAELRASYLQMRAGVAVPKARRLVVEAAVKEIIGCPSADV